MSKAILRVGFVVSLFCLALPVFAADGWASMNGGTTGGAGGAIVTATTAAQFKSYVESNDSPLIVQVSGTIDLNSVGGAVEIGSNKTIRGVDPNSKIIGRLRTDDDASNIIIERLNITNPNPEQGSQYDGISVRDGATNVFITHCTVYDCADGLIDITNEADYVTVSWCKFYYVSQSTHRFSILVGGDDDEPNDIGKLHVTFHHNWWSTLCHERMPRVRYGPVHVYNNYYDCHGNGYCIGVGDNSQIRVEDNYFDSVNQLWKKYDDASNPGSIGWNSTNVYAGSSTEPTWASNDYATIFIPPYSYTPDSANDVPTIVTNGAGASGGDATPPAAPTGLTATTIDGTASLNWNNNTEGDLAGYYVYRSTNSGGVYSRLNGSPLASSDYNDNTVTNGIIYYYVVTAVDTNSNESNYSDEVPSGLYGDFTGNGIVEMNDLPDFLDFWLANGCNEPYWLDLDGDCIVNFYEFSVLAENWLEN